MGLHQEPWTFQGVDSQLCHLPASANIPFGDYSEESHNQYKSGQGHDVCP